MIRYITAFCFILSLTACGDQPLPELPEIPVPGPITYDTKEKGACQNDLIVGDLLTINDENHVFEDYEDVEFFGSCEAEFSGCPYYLPINYQVYPDSGELRGYLVIDDIEGKCFSEPVTIVCSSYISGLYDITLSCTRRPYIL